MVSHPNGSQTRIELFTMHKITMTNDSVFVFSLGSKIVMDNSEILRFTFENVTSGIKSVVIVQHLEQLGEFIYITPADYSKTLHLFDIEGHALCPNVTLTDNGIVISLSELP